jgi:hypothetical protein
MPSQDYIKGKADIFSFVLEILSGVRVPLTCGEIVDRVERYVNTPIRNPASVTADYHAGVMEAMTHFRGYFVPQENIINPDAVKHIYNAVEERFEELWRLLDTDGPKMTLGELCTAEAAAKK